jgi:hypothetical protein
MQHIVRLNFKDVMYLEFYTSREIEYEMHPRWFQKCPICIDPTQIGVALKHEFTSWLPKLTETSVQMPQNQNFPVSVGRYGDLAAFVR